METNRTRRLTARQLAKALAVIDAQLAPIDAALASFHVGYSDSGVFAAMDDETRDAVTDAWNGLHDAARALRGHRARVEANPHPIPAHELGTWELVQQNID